MFSNETSGSIPYGPWEQEYTENYFQIALQVPIHAVAKIEKHRVTCILRIRTYV